MNSETTLNRAKSRLVLNVITNIFVILISSLVGILLTPYLIKSLGLDVYGLIPLLSSIVAYLGLFTTSITSTLGRFSSISIGKMKFDEANLYFSTAVTSLLLISVIIMLGGLIAISILEKLIQIPSGYENDCKFLFMFTLGSFCTAAAASPYSVSTLVNHRFDIYNYINVIAKLLQPLILVYLFTLFTPHLSFVGFSYFSSNLIILLGLIWATRKLSPYLKYSPTKFDFDCFKAMSKMSIWSTIDHIGALLYLSIDLVLINHFLGAEKGGLYAPFVQLVMLVTLLVDALSRVFTPVAYELVASEDLRGLSHQTIRSIKFIGLGIALPSALMCGFSEPLLLFWLGPEFQKNYLLVWILVAPSVFIHPVRPLFAVQRGLNKVEYPAIMTLLGGITNLGLSIFFVKYTNLDIMGVGIATCISLILKNLFFTPIYSSRILKENVFKFYKALIPGAIAGSLSFGMIYAFSLSLTEFDFLSILLFSVLFLPIYMGSVYLFFLNNSEKNLIWNILKLKRSPNVSF